MSLLVFYHCYIHYQITLLLLLSRFSRVQLCDPIDGSPPGSPCPWDSPGKNTGVGCHFLLQCMKVKSEREVAELCPTLRDPMDWAHQAPPSMGFSRQEYWSGVPLPSPKEKVDGIKKWVRPGFSPAHTVAGHMSMCIVISGSEPSFLSSYKLEGIFMRWSWG